ncbi:MAG: hypothetical protein ACRC2G_13885 [Aestuariivirga sp.]
MSITRVVFGGLPDYLEPSYAGVTLTSTPASSSGYPISRLRERPLYLKTRWPAGSDLTISWTYGGEVRDISAVGLFDHNFPGDATVRVLLYSTNVFTVGVTDPIYDSGELIALYSLSSDYVTSESPEWGAFDWGGLPPEDVVLSLPRNFIHPIMQLDPAGSGLSVPRHIQAGGGALVISGLSTVANSYSAAGMLMTTKLWQPTRNFRWNFKLGMKDLGDPPTIGSSGVVFGRDRGRIRQMSMQLDLLRRSEILEFPWTFNFTRGLYSPLLVIPEPDSPEWWWAFAGIWRLENNIAMEAQPTAQRLWSAGGLSLLDWR